MNTKCLTEKQILMLVDGGIPPNEAEAIHAHIAGCAACREAVAEAEAFAADLAAPVDLDVDAHAAAIAARLDQARPARPTPPRAWSRLAAVASVAALAAALAFLVSRPSLDGPTFVARGVHESTLERDVGVSFFVGTSELSPVREGSTIAATAPISATYTNVHSRPAHVLVFAVDATRTVHWLYPAYVDVNDDPPALTLDRVERARPFGTSTILDAPAKGSMRLVTIVSETVLHVSDVERLPASALTLPSLRRTFPSASVHELHIEIP